MSGEGRADLPEEEHFGSESSPVFLPWEKRRVGWEAVSNRNGV